MDQPVGQHLPLLSFSLQSGPSYEIDPATHHSTYAAGGVATQSSDLISSNGIRCAPTRVSAHDSAYPITSGLSESGPGSISTSPSSSASSLTYPASSTTAVYTQSNTGIGLAANPFPSASQVFPTQYAFPQTYSGIGNARPRLASISDTTSGILNAARSPSVGNQLSPTSTASIRDQYVTSTPGLSRHLVSPRSTLESFSRSYNGYAPDPPRTMMSSASIPISPQYGTTAPMDNRANDSPPFLEHQTINEIVCNGQTIRPNIEAKIEKGFFMSNENCWTCYRRNYFSVLCSYSLTPHPANSQLYLMESGQKTQQPIQALGICLSAAVDNGGGKSIELVQHTPKRDKGPQNPIHITKLSPTPPGPKQLMPPLPHGFPMNTFEQSAAPQPQPPPYLPLQAADSRDSSQDSSAQAGYPQHPSSPTSHSHTFERIQFKNATQNNGKRRAQQQYYHLIVELWVDVRNINDKEANWKKVVQRVSHQVVVRGRSPSHYQNEGPHSTSTRGGPGGASGSGSGNLSLAGSLGSTAVGYARTFGNSNYGSGYRGQTYHGSIYSMDPTPIGSALLTSSGSNDGLPVEAIAEHTKSLAMHSSGDEEDVKGYETGEGYEYIPGPLFDHGPTQTAKTEVYEPLRIKDEPHPGAFPPGGIAHAFRGVDTSRGFYPSVATGY